MDLLQTRLDALEQHVQTVHQQLHTLTRRLRWWRGLAGGLAVLGLLGWGLPLGLAREDAPDQEKGEKGLAHRVAALEDLLKHFSREKNEIFITGANLHLVNGIGRTDCGNPDNPIPGCLNGLGNLIVGYNESRGPITGSGDDRTGSHNVVVGRGHNFSRVGGLVVGDINTISGDFAVVSGGRDNTASGGFAVVSGGSLNEASGGFAVVSSGESNTASGVWSAVSGGQGNRASRDFASVSGGQSNEASGVWSVVSGGAFNTASGVWSAVSGGAVNEASSEGSAVSGGAFNTASGQLASVSGGQNNTASNFIASVRGGAFNTASGVAASISGGGADPFTAEGQGNTASGLLSAVSGGQNRTAAGEFNWVAGSLVEDD